jgi:hypothetical protein
VKAFQIVIISMLAYDPQPLTRSLCDDILPHYIMPRMQRIILVVWMDEGHSRWFHWKPCVDDTHHISKVLRQDNAYLQSASPTWSMDKAPDNSAYLYMQLKPRYSEWHFHLITVYSLSSSHPMQGCFWVCKTQKWVGQLTFNQASYRVFQCKMQSIAWQAAEILRTFQ